MSDRHRVRLLPVAEEDLEEIVGYVALDDVAAASKLADRIEANLERLSGFPELGRVPRDGDLREAGYRYVIIGEWLAFYTIEKRAGRRDYKELL